MINIEKMTDTNDVEELISKKELLTTTQISYGQLYRWKRMNIIPETWFIKKSTITGQETFFKKKQILERIQTILDMKDDVSLEEIADLFNKKETQETTVELQMLVDKGLVSEVSKDLLVKLCGKQLTLDAKALIVLSAIERFLLKSVVSLDEMKMVVEFLNPAYEKLYQEEGRVRVYRKFGVSFVIGCLNKEEIVVDEHAVLVCEIELVEAVRQFHKKLML